MSGELSRRQLLRGAGALAASSRWLGGCASHPIAPPGPALTACADPFAGGVDLGTVPFLEPREGGPLGVATSEGLNGRLFTDLSRLEPDALITPTESYYVRTRYPDLLDPNAPWKISLDGLVKAPLDVGLERLLPLVRPSFGPFVMECSGNGAFAAFGMLSAATWAGVPFADVLALVDKDPRATRVAVSGFDRYSTPPPPNSTPGASWIFTFAELEAAGAFFATSMNDAPLAKDHGAPIRLIVPNWYGCACIKWVDTITLVDDEAPATSQMQEFASRTHQDGVPALARNYKPATIDQAAMPIRIEKWQVGGSLAYRVVGIMWGGSRVTEALTIRFNPNEPFVPVDVCPKQATNATWTLWSHRWTPAAPGDYAIDLAIADPTIPTKRLDEHFYRRTVRIEEVTPM